MRQIKGSKQVQKQKLFQIGVLEFVLLSLGFLAILGSIYGIVWTSNLVATTAESDGPNQFFSLGETIHPWSSAQDTKTSDNKVSYCFVGGGGVSDYLVVSGFNFRVPRGATIKGITAKIEKSAWAQGFVDHSVQLVLDGSTPVGANRADLKSEWLKTDEIKEYGGALNIWGLDLESSQINSPNFGVALRVKNNAATPSWIDVDHISMIVEYDTQVGPGGVADGLTLWLDANNELNGDKLVSTWHDQSGLENHASSQQSIPLKIELDAINHNRAIRFKKANSFFEGKGLIGINELFAVILPECAEQKNNNLLFSFTTENQKSSFLQVFLEKHHQTDLDQGTIVCDQGNTWQSSLNFNQSPTKDVEQLLLNLSFSKPETKSNSFINGALIEGIQKGNFTYPNAEIKYGIGSLSNASYTGLISEVISYSRTLNEREKKKVNTYLAIKYGLDIKGSYLLSDGSVVWADSVEGDFRHRMLFVGRDDFSRLNQVASQCKVNGEIRVELKHVSNSGLKTKSQVDFLENYSYIMIGDNNGSFKFKGHENEASASASAGLIFKQLDRVWRVNQDGAVENGQIKILIPTDCISLRNAKAEDVKIVLSKTTDFSRSLGFVSPCLNEEKSILTFDKTFGDGVSYFSIAIVKEEKQDQVVTEFEFINTQKFDDKVDLSWSLYDSEPISHFIIERSSDSISWNRIFSQPFFHENEEYYAITDSTPFKSLCFYRVKAFSNSQLEAIAYSEKLDFSHLLLEGLVFNSCYPNPFKDALTLDFNVEFSGIAVLAIIDHNGSALKTKAVSVSAGQNLINWNLADLASGTYLLRISKDNFVDIKRVVKF